MLKRFCASALCAINEARCDRDYDRSVTRRLGVVSLLFVLALGAGGCGGDQRKLDPSKHGGVIIYSSRIAGEPGLSDLYAANADGAGTHRLTETAGQCESTPVLTPDQLSFYFYRFPCSPAEKGDDEQGNYWDRNKPSFWKMNIDGSGEFEVLKLRGGDSAEEAFPSPDGKTIAIVGRGMQIVRADESGSFERTERAPVALPGQFGHSLWPIDMEWSSDGEFFVLPLQAERGTALFSVDAQSLEVKQLTHPEKDSEVDLVPVISGDGGYVAFVREEDTGGGELHYGGSLIVVDRESGEEQKLPGGEASPITFTPDGKALLYDPDSIDSNGYGAYSLADGKTRLFICSQRAAMVSPDGKRTLNYSQNGDYTATLVTADVGGANKNTLGKVRQDDLYGMAGPTWAWSEPGFSQSPRRVDFGRCRQSSRSG